MTSTTRTLLIVAAHPDDDCFIAGGLVARHRADPAVRFVLVHATRGEAGSSEVGFPPPGPELGRIRAAEAQRSWQALGRRPDRHYWLGYADGRLTESVGELTVRVAAIMDEERPDVVITFGPDGLTGHPDHAAVSAATTAAFEQFTSGTDEPRRLVHAAIPAGQLDAWTERLVRNGWTLRPEHRDALTGVPDHEIGLTVDCRSVVRRVKNSLAAHRSQAHIFRRIPAEFLDARLGTLYGVVAAGVRGHAPMLHDIFDDLDRALVG
jgi:N-acetyl-1-D-myo-inositol-2-amino-2-deoxy-alpha-D-glucopyranoside deacetylase